MKGLRRARFFLGSLLSVSALLWVSSVAASDPGDRVSSLVSEASYRHYLDDMLYTHLGDNRGFGIEHDLAQANIVSILTSFGLEVTLEPVSYYGSTYYNVVGTQWGTLYPDQEYLIGAHYDSVNNPGADDNASGTALMLEAARVLSEFDSEYTIRFIAFDREEQGLWGSEQYVQDHISDDIVAMISADMVAFNTGANAATIECVAGSSSLMNSLEAAVQSYADGLIGNTSQWTCCSDHVPFHDAGFQACLLIEDWGNPNYHTSIDSVDTPNYIDYAYATKMTRSIVGFLVDHAGVIVDPIDADYDGDGDVDADDYSELLLCFSAPDTPPSDPSCLFFDFNGDNDVDCGDAGQFSTAWTAPGSAPTPWQCELEPAVAAGDGGRCFTVETPASTRPMALLVTGDPDDPSVVCLSKYVQADGHLGSSPVFQSSGAWTGILVCAGEIHPGTQYDIWCDFGTEGIPVLSPAASATTAVWGDTVGKFLGDYWEPPDGVARIMDIVAILDTFRALPGAPPIHWVDLIGTGPSGIECEPDQLIGTMDLVMALDAFSGFTFEKSTGCVIPCG